MVPRYPVSVASSVILAVNLINLNGLKILCINKTFSRHCQLLLQRNCILFFPCENNGGCYYGGGQNIRWAQFTHKRQSQEVKINTQCSRCIFTHLSPEASVQGWSGKNWSSAYNLRQKWGLEAERLGYFCTQFFRLIIPGPVTMWVLRLLNLDILVWKEIRNSSSPSDNLKILNICTAGLGGPSNAWQPANSCL